MASTLTIGSDLKTRRQAAGISQQRWAELASCSLSMARVVESGYEPKNSEVLPRLIAVLNLVEAPGRNLDGKATDAAALIDPSTSIGHADNVTDATSAGVGDGHVFAER